MAGAGLTRGTMVGQYRIESRLGAGAMGVVYLARHEALQRRVALKVMSAELSSDSSSRGRFLREAQMLANVDSASVVTVLDAGSAAGVLYIAMKYHEEGDLGRLLARQGKLSTMHALRMVSEISIGLAAIHGKGVLHRDVKPANILLRRDEKGELAAALGDFGIAKALDLQATTTVGVIGTLAYMAPERHLGKDASAATDIYALGCVLWELLVGNVPYPGRSVGQIAVAHLTEPVRQLPSDNPWASTLNPLLTSTMAKEEGLRPTAGQLCEQMSAFLRRSVVMPPAPAVGQDRTEGPPERPGVSESSTQTRCATQDLTRAADLPEGSVGGHYWLVMTKKSDCADTPVIGNLPPGVKLYTGSQIARGLDVTSALAGTPTRAGSWELSLAPPSGDSEPIRRLLVVEERPSITCLSPELQSDEETFRGQTFVNRRWSKCRRGRRHAYQFRIEGGVAPFTISESRFGSDDDGVDYSANVDSTGRVIHVAVLTIVQPKWGSSRTDFLIRDKWNSSVWLKLDLKFR